MTRRPLVLQLIHVPEDTTSLEHDVYSDTDLVDTAPVNEDSQNGQNGQNGHTSQGEEEGTLVVLILMSAKMSSKISF